jgi:uncharacterized protein (DUF58 family)
VTSLSPESLQQIKRLDLRARMVVKGFLQGLHTSPLQGFSVQFSEHRRYNRGDDPKLIDWLAYAKTDRYFIKRFEAETNMTGYLVVDLSGSMQLTANDSGAKISSGMSKFEYCVLLAASLTYLMTMQQDPVGLITISDKLRALLPARSRRNHMGDVISSLSKLTPSGPTNFRLCIEQLAKMLRQKSLVMIFSDLLPSSGDDDQSDPAEALVRNLTRLKHGGHDVIVFHVLDQSEVEFSFEGPVLFEDAETGETITVDADGFRDEYLAGIESFRSGLKDGLGRLGIDYVPLHTGMPFDKALAEYLVNRNLA